MTDARIVQDLSANDSLWLNMDSPENLMVIDSVMWFDHRLDAERVVHQVQHRMVDRYPVFTWRPVFSTSVGDADHWALDEDFDIHRHVTVHELGGAGGRPELQAFLEARMSEPLDPGHPIWHAYLLQGSEFGAILIRFHHAIADGTALARVLIEMTTDHPDEDLELPDVPAGRLHPADQPSPEEEVPVERGSMRKRDRAINALSHAVTLPLAVGVKATSGAARLLELLDLDRPGSMVARLTDQTVGTAETLDKLVVSTPPNLALFARPGLAKRADWAPAHDLAAVKRAAKTRGATVNDLMLAAVAGGIRRYLETRGEPLADVMTMVPVNLRPPDAPLPPHLGNRFALVAMVLPVEGSTPQERLDLAHERMEVIKSGPEVYLTYGVSNALGVVGTFASQMSRMTQEFIANKAVGVTTNVPGPPTPRYFAGQRLVGILGWVPGAAHQTVGVCIYSYADEIRVGFKTDVNAVPDVANLVAAYQAEIDELLALGEGAEEA